MNGYRMTGVETCTNTKTGLADLRLLVIARSVEEAFRVTPGAERFVVEHGRAVLAEARAHGIREPGYKQLSAPA